MTRELSQTEQLIVTRIANGDHPIVTWDGPDDGCGPTARWDWSLTETVKALRDEGIISWPNGVYPWNTMCRFSIVKR